MKNGYVHMMIGLAVILIPLSAFAQELHIVDSASTQVGDPSVYRAYYGKLAGEPQVFTFTTKSTLTHLKLVVLMPDVPGSKNDVSAVLIDQLHPESPFVTGDGALIEWQRFYDTAGRESYLAGPTLEATVPPGNYQVRVWSSNNDSPYTLIFQGENTFSLSQIFSRFSAMPKIKNEFFGKSAFSAFATPLLLWPVLCVLIFAALIIVAVIIYSRRRQIARRYIDAK